MYSKLSSLLFLVLLALSAPAQKINRKELVQRHNVVVNKPDSLSSLTVGNGRFAFTVDVTGLQTFPENYAKGVSLGTQSEWGWHSFIDTVGYRREEAQRTYNLNGRDITYTVQWNSPDRNKAVSNWFRQNPHRLQLGNLGLQILLKDGRTATLADIRNIKQELDLWTGEITSRFTVEGLPVEVRTAADAKDDIIGARISSPLIAAQRLKVRIRFPYPTGAWTDEGIDYSHTDKHRSVVMMQHSNGALLRHQLDTTNYYIGFAWKGTGSVKQQRPHDFLVTPDRSQQSFSFTARFSPRRDFNELLQFEQVAASSIKGWNEYWNSGAAIDFKGSSDPRAKELERRVVLSQYLMKTQEAGDFPPQETGLTYNSWFGKPHLEMHWWHTAHYALWGRTPLMTRSLDWYFSVADKAAALARRQGFEGVRWQKMTDNLGDETPSSVGALLIWQQPHFIYFAELAYREGKDPKVLQKYKDLVFATADFMASFAYDHPEWKRYILGKGVIPAQERFKAETTFNPGYELVYWHWALQTAQQWRQRLGMQKQEKWNDVVKRLSPLAVQDGLYLAAESATDSYTNPEYRTDHPSILAAFGIMPPTGQVDTAVMGRTFQWIWNNWTWRDTWGWDFPMTAMTATRLGMPEKAIDALLMPIQTNTYLPNGHNYQDERLRVYMPGNGGILTAIAMMVGGYDGATQNMPGIPKNGKWKVRYEGLKKMP